MCYTIKQHLTNCYKLYSKALSNDKYDLIVQPIDLARRSL